MYDIDKDGVITESDAVTLQKESITVHDILHELSKYFPTTASIAATLSRKRLNSKNAKKPYVSLQAFNRITGGCSAVYRVLNGHLFR